MNYTPRKAPNNSVKQQATASDTGREKALAFLTRSVLTLPKFSEKQRVCMSRAIALPVFVDSSLSFFCFLLLVILFV